MAFSAGTVFLDVVPSFHNLQRRAERETAPLGAALAKNVEKGLNDGTKSAGKAGDKAAKEYGGAFAKKLQADLRKAADAIDIKASLDSTGAERDLAKLSLKIRDFADLEIRPQLNGAEALAEARLFEQQLEAIVRDQNVDIDFRFNAAQARDAARGIGAAIQRSIGATPEEYAEAKRINDDLTRQRVEGAKRVAEAQKDAARTELNMVREVAQFRRQQAEEAVRYAAWQKDQQAEMARLQVEAQHENRVYDAERVAATRQLAAAERAAIDTDKNMARVAAQFRKEQAQTSAAERLRVEREFQAESLRLTQVTERARADLQRAVAVQNERVAVASTTGARPDASSAQSAIDERYRRETLLAQASAAERIHAAARVAAGEMSASQRSQQAQEEGYKEVARAAAASAAARVAAARLAAAVERRSRPDTANGGGASAGALLGQATGQAANSFRLFNGAILAAVTLGPLLIPLLASIAAGMGAIAVASIGAVAGVGALVAGFGGIGTAVQALSGVAKENRKQAAGSGAGDPAKDMRGLRDANEALGRARADAGRQIAAAARQQEQAERSLTSAIEDAADAQRDLLQARRDTARDLEDQNARLASGLLQEQLGAFALQEAGFRFNNVMEDPQASARERQVAELEYRQAQQQQADLARENRRLETDTAAANAAGVEGASQVVAAQQRIVDTTQAVADAQVAVKDASDGAARARVEEARTIADAEQRVSDAMVDLQAKSVAAGVAGSAAMDALNESMRGLSPAGQEFATFLFGLEPLLQRIRFAAQEGMLPGFQEALTAIIDTYGPSFIAFIGQISTVIGDLAVKAGNALTQPFWVNFFSMMAQYAPIFLEQFASISGSLLTMIAGVLMAFAPFSKEIGDAFVAIAGSMAEWGANLAGSQAFTDFLTYVTENGPKIAALLLGILTIVLKLFVGLEPYATLLLDIALSFVTWLAAMDPQQLAQIAGVILAVVAGIQILSGIIAVVSGVVNLFVGLILASRVAFALMGSSVASVVLPILGIIAAVALVVVAIVLFVNWITTLYQTNETFARIVDTIWGNIVAVFQFAWGIISGIFNAWWSVISTYIVPIIMFFGGVISDVFTGIWTVIQVAWQIISKVFDMWVQIITFIIAPMFRNLYEQHIKPVWEQYIQPLFDAFGRFLEEHVAPAFQRGLDVIKAIWEGIKEIAKVPVKFVVETVINKGIIDNFNDLAKIFPGMTPISHVKLPDGFATGGVLPGYTPGRDVHRFFSPTAGAIDLSGGEAIMRPEFTAAAGVDWINQANAAARRGGVGGVRKFLGGYADGGVLGWIGRAAGDATDAISSAVRGIGDFLADPGATLRRVVEGFTAGTEGFFPQLVAQIPLRIVDGVVGLVSKLRGGDDTPVGGVAPLSAGGIGWQAMESTVRQMFPDARFTSAFRPGAITAVGTKSYHGLGRAIDIAPRMEIFNWLSQMFPGSRELFYSPAGPGRQILNGHQGARLAPVTVADHFDHVHWAYENGGIVPNLYDNGGMLPPGLSMVENKTGKPEPILTDGQWKMLANRSKGDGGVNVTVQGDVVGTEQIVQDFADRIAMRSRDAAVLHQLNDLGVSL